jgi:hypothetical protein
VQKAMRRAPEDADALYQAALVYALLGERASAIATASRAIEKGVAPGWFALPWFDSVRGEPEFPRRRARG